MTRYPQGNLKGVNTPWDDDYQLAEDVFVRHTERMLGHGYTHLYVMGTAGEGHALTDDVYRRVVDVFSGVMRGPGLHPQVGVISLSTTQTIERIAYGLARGIDTFQIVLPSWGVMHTDEKVSFFQTVCGEFPDARFLHYNYPNGMNTMTAPEYERVIELVPNLVATKTSTMDMGFIRALMDKAGELQHFFLQGPYPYGAMFGECSLISSLAPLFPRTSMRLFEAGRDGDIDTAFSLQRRLIDVAAGLYAAVGRRHIDGAYDKLTSWLIDPEFPRRLLPPFSPLSDEEAAAARTYYETHCSDLD